MTPTREIKLLSDAAILLRSSGNHDSADQLDRAVRRLRGTQTHRGARWLLARAETRPATTAPVASTSVAGGPPTAAILLHTSSP